MKTILKPLFLFSAAFLFVLFTAAQKSTPGKEAEGIWRYKSVEWLDSTVVKSTSAQTLFYYHDSTIDVPFYCLHPVGCEFPDGYIRLKTKWNGKDLVMYTPQKEWEKVGTWNGKEFVLTDKSYVAHFVRVKEQDLDAANSNEINIIHDRKVFHY